MGKIITSDTRVGYGDKERSDNRQTGYSKPGQSVGDSGVATNARVPVKNVENLVTSKESPAKPATRSKQD